MSRKRGKAPAREGSWAPELLKLLLAASLPLLLGALGYFVTPLRTLIMERVWREDVELRLHAPSTSQQDGDEFDLHIWAIPKSPVDVSPGLLHVTSEPEGVLQLLGSDAGITVPSFSAPLTLTSKENAIRVIALNAGEATVTARLRTDRGEYAKSVRLRIARRAPTGRPSRSDYTGTWIVNIGPYSGTMDLSDRGKNFFGKYSVTGGPSASGAPLHGVIEGLHDGERFTASAFRGNATRKWLIAACIIEHGADVELKGSATPHVAQGDHWVPKGDKMDFWAGSGRLGRVARSPTTSPCGA